MIEERNKIITLIQEAQQSGARQSSACEVVGISAKTFQRWCRSQGDNTQDGRLEPAHVPVNKLGESEKKWMIDIANEPGYGDLSPSKIVPLLADEGLYIASESSFYRVLKANDQLTHRQKSKPTRQIKKPKALVATGANQIYSWDITYLPTTIKGIFCILSIFQGITKSG